MPFKTDFLEGLILLYSNQISNCQKTLFPRFMYAACKKKKDTVYSCFPLHGIFRTNIWYKRY